MLLLLIALSLPVWAAAPTLEAVLEPTGQQPEQALARYRELLADDPQGALQAEILVVMGDLHEELGQLILARDAYEQALSAGAPPLARQRLAGCLRQLGDAQGALEHLSVAVEELWAGDDPQSAALATAELIELLAEETGPEEAGEILRARLPQSEGFRARLALADAYLHHHRHKK